MKILDAPPRFRLIKKPAGDERLEGFCSGTEEPWEIHVNEMVEKQFLGTANWRDVTMVAMLNKAGDVMGLSGYRPRPLNFVPPPPPPETVPAYIYVIGLSVHFRGWRMPDGETRLGYELLADTLKKIAAYWTGTKMPATWSLINPENTDSERIHGECDFSDAEARAGDHPWYRPYGLPLS